MESFLLPWNTVFYQRYQSAAKIFKVKANYKIKQIASVFPIVFGQTQIPVSQAVNLASFTRGKFRKHVNKIPDKQRSIFPLLGCWPHLSQSPVREELSVPMTKWQMCKLPQGALKKLLHHSSLTQTWTEDCSLTSDSMQPSTLLLISTYVNYKLVTNTFES